MWPWGHAAFGYLLYSFGARAAGERPQGVPVIVLAVATQLPDVVDKSLSWGLDVFPQGYAVGHSLFVGVPLGVAVLALAWRTDRLRTGLAAVVGYWSHLVGDMAYGLLSRNPYWFDRMLWPVVTLPPYDSDVGFARLFIYVGEFLSRLSTGAAFVLVAIYFGPFLFAVVVWLLDGAPGVRTIWRFIQPTR